MAVYPRWLYMQSFVADGNFKANHLKQSNDGDDVWLTNGEAFMTNVARYHEHLAEAQETKTVNSDSLFSFVLTYRIVFRNQHVTDIGPS